MSDSLTCRGRNGRPVKEYLTLADAQSAADYVKTRHKNNMIPYQCARCGRWHLSPASRHTPSQTCACIDHNGKAKESYQTEADAKKRAAIIYREKGVSLSVYPCPLGNGYHLTSR
jgi:endogenous inhibitor of DNA gyrase (YacG/DUF329 family)